MQKYIKFLLLMFFMCNFIYVSNANAAIINAESCSQSDVQSAIDSAIVGDTVVIPAGDCTWTRDDIIEGITLIINAASCSQLDVQSAIDSAIAGDTVAIPAGDCTWTSDVTINKGITLQGAGIGKTNITNGQKSNYDGVLEIIGNETASFRVTGFTFKGSPNTNDKDRIIDILGTDKAWRVDKCRFENGYSDVLGRYVVTTPIYVSGYTYGVIDHCTFDEAGKELIQVLDDGSGSWSRPSSFGTQDAVYVEDCTFTHTRSPSAMHAIFADKGGRYVFRHNTVDDMNMDAHGYCGNEGGGTRHYEIYDNTFTVDIGQAQPRMMYLRGGTGVIFNNTMIVKGSLNFHIVITDHRPDRDCPQGGCCSEYPCKDQIGRGTNQELDPLYVWNNTVDGGPGIVTVFDYADPGECEGNDKNDINDFIQAGRDYILDERPEYESYVYPHPLTLLDAPVLGEVEG